MKGSTESVVRRYQSAGELAQDLRQYLHRDLIAARRAGMFRRGRKIVRRHPTAAVSVLAIVVASAIGVMAWTAFSGKAKSDVARLVSEARLMMERGEYRPGLEKAKRALALDPANHEARLVRARMLLQRAHFVVAAEEAFRVFREDPGNWEAHLVVAVAAGNVPGGDLPSIDAQEHLAAVEGRVPDTADAFELGTRPFRRDTATKRRTFRDVDSANFRTVRLSGCSPKRPML